MRLFTYYMYPYFVKTGLYILYIYYKDEFNKFHDTTRLIRAPYFDLFEILFDIWKSYLEPKSIDQVPYLAFA